MCGSVILTFNPNPMKNKMQENPNQTTKILLYLKEGNKITGMDALNLFGCWRLGARIHNIRAMGFNVKTDLITTSTKKVIAEYSMGKNYRQTQLEL